MPRLDVFIQTVQARRGTTTANLARTVVSGVLGLAVRHDAMPANPARDIGRLTGPQRRAPRALSPDERRAWIARLRGDEDAKRKDLPDLCAWMLATGVRIGDALAVSWGEVDLSAGTVRIEHTVIRAKGVGLIRKGTTSSAGERTLTLPAFAVSMLRRRRLASGGHVPVFPDSAGGWRDPSNTSRDLRNARGSEEFAWVTSHAFRKTAATELDLAGSHGPSDRRPAGAREGVHERRIAIWAGEQSAAPPQMPSTRRTGTQTMTAPSGFRAHKGNLDLVDDRATTP